jgi:hypothetical protein
MKHVSCQEVEPLLPATAAGALDQDEAHAVKAHLAGCPPCVQSLHELEETVEQLAYAVPQVAPPAELRIRVLRAVITTPQVSERGMAHGPFLAASIPRAGAPPRSLAHLGGAYQRLAPALLAAALILLVGGSVWLGSMTQRLTAMEQRLAQQDAVYDLLRQPGSEMAALKPVGANVPAGGQAIMAPGRHEVAIMATRLPQLPAGRAYQLWLLKRGGSPPVPAGLIRVDDAGVAMAMVSTPADPDQMAGMRITDEPESGSVAPTGASWLEGWYH